MTLHDRVMKAFQEALELDAPVAPEELVYRDFPQWTSTAHMALIAILEQDFDVMLDADDILNMSSFGKAVEIMAKHEVVAS